jgi:hypothetical protein
MGLMSSVPAKTVFVAESIRRTLLEKDKERLPLSIVQDYYSDTTCEFLYNGDKPYYLVAKDNGNSIYRMPSGEILHVHKVGTTNDLIVETRGALYIIASELSLFTKERRQSADMILILKELNGYTTLT